MENSELFLSEQEHNEEAVAIESDNDRKYVNFSMQKLLEELHTLVERSDIDEIRSDVESIKTQFYKKWHQMMDLLRQSDKSEEEINTELEQYREQEEVLKKLLQSYKEKKQKHNLLLETEREKNYEMKQSVIEEIKKLTSSNESIDVIVKEFRHLQDKWKKIGEVATAKSRELWDTYHHHVEIFYNYYMKLHKEFLELDFQKNLESKIQLCEQLEAMLSDGKIVDAIRQLQFYHDRWREIGPVAIEHKEPLWLRFKAVTAELNNRYQEYIEIRKKESEQFLQLKQELCTQMENLIGKEYATLKDWQQATTSVLQIQEEWRKIGHIIDRKASNNIFERFRTLTNAFFTQKRAFFKQLKEHQNTIIKEREQLCEIVENELQAEHSKDALQRVIDAQKRWKTIEYVQNKKVGDLLWKRFQTACNSFFDQKNEQTKNQRQEQDALTAEVIAKKEEIIRNIKNLDISDNETENLQNLKQYQQQWQSDQRLPKSVFLQLQQQYDEALTEFCSKANIEGKQKELLLFKANMATSPQQKFQTRAELQKKHSMIENQIQRLENNLSFFAKSENSISILRDFEQKINKLKKELELIKNKLKLIN